MLKDMTKGSPIKIIVLFSLPLIIGNVFQQFYSIVDTLIVGRTLGVNALAAVGSTGAITVLNIGFITGLTSGLSIITAQRFGAKDEEGVKRSFAIGILISLAVAVFMTLFSVLTTRTILEILKTPKEIITDAQTYILIIFGGIPALILFNYLSNILRALGDSKTPLYYLIAACFINIVLDYVCILYLRMGVAGAGVATVFSQLLSGILCVAFIRKKVPILWLKREYFHVKKEEVFLYLKISLPMAFQASIIAIGALTMQYALNRLGPTAVAATTAASKIDSIAVMPLGSVATTMSTYVAQNYGAGKITRIWQGVHKSIILSVGFSVLMGVGIVLYGKTLCTFFVGNKEFEVLRLAQLYLRIVGCSYFVLALLFIYRLSIQGLGRSLIPTICGGIELVMRVFSALVLTDMYGFIGASFSGPLAWCGALVPAVIAYYAIVGRLVKQQRENDN